MSSNNNDDGAAMGFALIFALLAFLGMFIFAVLAFVVCILTMLSLVIVMLNKPLTFGKGCITVKDARNFILGGILGAAILPAFIAFCSAIFGISVNWDYLPQILGAGYVAGSIGVDILLPDDESGNAAATNIPPQMQLPPPSRPEPFKFASWDDEEKRR